jgi:hypothetical protein
MPILKTITAISGSYSDIAVNLFDKKIIYIDRHFFPSGKPILPHMLCCGPFAVDEHSFMGRCLASAASSTCE